MYNQYSHKQRNKYSLEKGVKDIFTAKCIKHATAAITHTVTRHINRKLLKTINPMLMSKMPDIF